MADSKFTPADLQALVASADTTVDAVYAAYDLALELATLLQVFADLDPMPGWAFPLARLAGRVRDQSDEAHTSLLRLRCALRVSHGLPKWAADEAGAAA